MISVCRLHPSIYKCLTLTLFVRSFASNYCHCVCMYRVRIVSFFLWIRSSSNLTCLLKVYSICSKRSPCENLMCVVWFFFVAISSVFCLSSNTPQTQKFLTASILKHIKYVSGWYLKIVLLNIVFSLLFVSQCAGVCVFFSVYQFRSYFPCSRFGEYDLCVWCVRSTHRYKNLPPVKFGTNP